MNFDPGFDIEPLPGCAGFRLGEDCFDRGVEYRRLDALRQSLMEPDCEGPDPVYAIMMDVGRKQDLPALQERMLLFGVVTYAAGQLGREPIRSQGHIHKVSAHCGWSTPEVYEIWQGKAVIYMQETAQDNPGRCFAVEAEPGDVVVVPPCCDRDYGFEYGDVRRHGGIAWFPLVEEGGGLRWEKNPAYRAERLIIKKPEWYIRLGLEEGKPIYRQFMEDPDRFLFVSDPARVQTVWQGFVP